VHVPDNLIVKHLPSSNARLLIASDLDSRSGLRTEELQHEPNFWYRGDVCKEKGDKSPINSFKFRTRLKSVRNRNKADLKGARRTQEEGRALLKSPKSSGLFTFSLWSLHNFPNYILEVKKFLAIW